MATARELLEKALSEVRELRAENAHDPFFDDADLPDDVRRQHLKTAEFLDATASSGSRNGPVFVFGGALVTGGRYELVEVEKVEHDQEKHPAG